MISLLIASNKEEITTLRDPHIRVYVSETIIDNTPGIGLARNKLGEGAHEETLLFLDDDIKISPIAWRRITQVRPEEVIMAQGYSHPITRVMAIKKETFNEIGGFDPNIKYNGEDLDFYWRALQQGYTVSIIPKCHIEHKDHRKANWTKAHFESAYTRIKHGRVSLDFFVQTNLLILLLRILGFIHYSTKGRIKWI